MVPMTVDWGAAGALAGKGFATVFIILVILAVITWLMGFVSQKIQKSKEETRLADKIERSGTKG